MQWLATAESLPHPGPLPLGEGKGEGEHHTLTIGRYKFSERRYGFTPAAPLGLFSHFSPGVFPAAMALQ